MANYMAIGGYNRPAETSRTITRFCGYGFFVTAPENQFGEFLERKRESIGAVPTWAAEKNVLRFVVGVSIRRFFSEAP
jgi:hypothetical protein